MDSLRRVPAFDVKQGGRGSGNLQSRWTQKSLSVFFYNSTNFKQCYCQRVYALNNDFDLSWRQSNSDMPQKCRWHLMPSKTIFNHLASFSRKCFQSQLQCHLFFLASRNPPGSSSSATFFFPAVILPILQCTVGLHCGKTVVIKIKWTSLQDKILFQRRWTFHFLRLNLDGRMGHEILSINIYFHVLINTLYRQCLY